MKAAQESIIRGCHGDKWHYMYRLWKGGTAWWNEGFRSLEEKKIVWKEMLNQPENSDEWWAQTVEYEVLNIKVKRMAYMKNEKEMRISGEK